MPAMSTSGALTGYYIDSLVMPDNEETRFPSGSGLIQHRPSVLPTDHTEIGPCTFPAKQAVYGGSGWGHIPTHFSSGVPSVYPPHTQPPVAGDYVQSWLLDSACGLPFTELPTVHHHYYTKPDTNRTNEDGTEASQASSHVVLPPGGFINGRCSTDTEKVSGRTDEKGGDIEEKPGANPGKADQMVRKYNNIKLILCTFLMYLTRLFNCGNIFDSEMFDIVCDCYETLGHSLGWVTDLAYAIVWILDRVLCKRCTSRL